MKYSPWGLTFVISRRLRLITSNLSSEVVKENILLRHSEAIEKVNY